MRTPPGRKLGSTGRRVAANLKALRGRVPVRELSDRLTTMGRPILPSGITAIEQGTRRVDVDDLIALALALDVTPNRLLLTEEARLDQQVEFFPNGAGLDTKRAWDWATASAAPIIQDRMDRSGKEPRTHGELLESMHRFMVVNRPNDPPDRTTFADMTPHTSALRVLADEIADLEGKGISRKAAWNFVNFILDNDVDFIRDDEVDAGQQEAEND